MEKIVERGIFISFIYLMAIVSTLIVTQRVRELDQTDFRNNNHALTIKIAR